MITRAFIEDVDYDNAKILVRIPTLDGTSTSVAATPKDQLEWAAVLETPGVEIQYNVGDVVVVGFEDNDLSSPIVLGFLKLKKGSTKNSDYNISLSVTNLSVSNDSVLPTSTQFTRPDKSSALTFDGLWNTVEGLK